MRVTNTFTLSLLGSVALAAVAFAQLPECVGDCNGDGVVTVDEILLGVNIALGVAPLDACPQYDTDRSGDLTVDELIAAIDAALGGCVAAARPTPAPTPTPTPNAAMGPRITGFGVAASDDKPVAPIGVDAEGRPIFSRLFGNAFWIVVEAAPGPGGRRLDPVIISEAPFDPRARPDVQIIVSRPLGDGSPVVCDHDPEQPPQGGVPAAEPFAFTDAQRVTDVMVEMSCRIRGGARTNPNDACTESEGAPFGFGFLDSASRMQVCVRIDRPWRFPVGDTIVAARVLDVAGIPGEVREIVVRVAQ